MRSHFRLVLFGCLFWRLPPPFLSIVDRTPLHERLELRLGPAVVRDLFTPGTRGLTTPEFGKSADADGFISVELARDMPVLFASSTDWSANIATALPPPEFARAVGELYRLALLRAYKQKTAIPTAEGEPDPDVKKIKTGAATEFRSPSTNDLYFSIEPFSVATPTGIEKFSRVIVPIPGAIAIHGRTDVTARELALTIDAKGRIIGVTPHLDEDVEKFARLALSHIGRRADTLAELARRQNRKTEIERELAELRAHEASCAKWEDSPAAAAAVARLRNEGVSTRASLRARWSPPAIARYLKENGLHAVYASFPLGLLFSGASGSLAVGAAAGAVLGFGVGTFSSILPLTSAINPAAYAAQAGLAREQNLSVLRNRIVEREAELRRLTTDHPVFAIALGKVPRK